MIYHADVSEHVEKTTGAKSGRFIATGRGFNLTVIDADAERQFCHEMKKRGMPDGPIQFYRADQGGVASVAFRSVYRAAAHITCGGNEFPRTRKRRESMGGGSGDGDMAAVWHGVDRNAAARVGGSRP